MVVPSTVANRQVRRPILSLSFPNMGHATNARIPRTACMYCVSDCEALQQHSTEKQKISPPQRPPSDKTSHQRSPQSLQEGETSSNCATKQHFLVRIAF